MKRLDRTVAEPLQPSRLKTTMDVGGSSPPLHHTFPARLWRLVNNPAYDAIRWDSEGTGIVADQLLFDFERQMLSAGRITLDGDYSFISTDFQGFLRQLHLYGFKRNVPANKYQTGRRRYFLNPNFKRNHPELVVNVRKASRGTKMLAGLEVCHRPLNDVDVTTDTSSLLSPPRHDSTPVDYSCNKQQHTTPYNGTPVPPRLFRRPGGAPLSPSVFVSDNRVPASLRHDYRDAFLGSNAWHSQQGLLAHAHHGKQLFFICSPPKAQHRPGHCSTAFKHYQPTFMAPHRKASGRQAVQVSPHIYYQASYSVDNQGVKKCNSNLEATSQIGDEAMPPLPSSCLARAVTPDKPRPVLLPSYNTCHALLLGNAVIPVNASLLCPTPQPIIMAASNNAYVVRHRQEEEFMLPVSEQMPDDAISQDIVMMERSLRE